MKTRMNLWGQTNSAVNVDVIRKVSKPFSILPVGISKQQPNILCQLQDFEFVPINLLPNAFIDLLHLAASKYNRLSLCKVSAKKHQNPDKIRLVIVFDVSDRAICVTKVMFVLH